MARRARSTAEVHFEEARAQGRKQGRRSGISLGEELAQQDTLVRQLRLRFGRVPRAVVQTIRETISRARLRTWLDRVLTAETLDDLRISRREGH
jgi:hypothetical protein